LPLQFKIAKFYSLVTDVPLQL